ncbi:hypothetical protein HYV88_00460 [Candidatus Woesearchaeota archaeon]|nr:hypothetical protein [Candidatus Woesearchaeota archaeon]
MALFYQGPKTLERPIIAVYEVSSKHLSRDTDLEVIVGEIEKIEIIQGKLSIKGDQEANSLIDKAHRKAIQPNGVISSLEDFKELQRICQELTLQAFNRTGAGGGHNPPMDFVYIPPSEALNCEVFFPMNTQNLIARANPHLLENHYKALKFPFIFAHELVHWDLAGTRFYAAARKAFLELEPVYDKKVHGKYPAPTEDASHLFKRPGSESIGRLQIQELQLGLREFGEAIADLISKKVFPPSPFVELIDSQLSTRPKRIEEIQKRLNSFQSPKELLVYAKQKIDESYDRNKPITELI